MPAEVAAGNLWLPAVAEFATNESLPSWFPWSRQQLTWYHVDDMDWGHVKMKKLDPQRMLAGIHQVIFWCGHAQQGYGAKAKRADKKHAKSAPAIAKGGAAPAVAKTGGAPAVAESAPEKQENEEGKNASAVAGSAAAVKAEDL